MWDNIDIEPGGTLRADHNTLIEDGKQAIYSNSGGNFQLDNITLNRNYKHIVLTPYGGAHPGSITNCNLLCQSFAGSPPTLNPPYSGYRTNTGIEITGCTSAHIGNTGGSNTNKFSNMNIGINSVKSSVTIVNNDFQNINTLLPPNTGVAAIQATGNPFFPLPYVACSVAIGDGTNAGQNTFSNCFIGIVTETNINANISHNDFQTINNKAIFVKNNGKTNTVIIADNDIKTSTIGIHCLNNTICNSTISNNRIVNMKPFATGIWLQEKTSMSVGAHYAVSNNTVKTLQYGVRAENLNKPAIDQNDIEIRTFAPSFIVSRGIEVMGNYGARITSNNIKCTPANYQLKNGGIYASLSPASYIYCNTVKNMGYGIKCAGTMASDLFNNSISNDYYGLWLDNNGFIGTQDDPSNPGQPSYNKWSNIPVPGYATTSFRTFTSNGSDGSASPIIYKTGAIPTSLNAKYAPFPTFNIGATPFTLTPTTSGTSLGPVCPAILPAKLLKRAADLALANINFPGNDANSKYLSKHGLYTNIVADSIDVSSDGILQTFVTTSTTDNLGKLTQLNATITNSAQYNTTSMTSAQSISSGISTTNDIETNMKFINDLVIGNYLSGTEYSASQINDLRILANKCPYTDGLAVYQARVLLSEVDSVGTVYYNECELSSETGRMMSSLENTEEITNTTFMVYPNPASTKLTVVYSLDASQVGVFEIYNIMGEKVVSRALNGSDNTATLSVEDLNSGVYFYKYSIDNVLIESKKLVIVK